MLIYCSFFLLEIIIVGNFVSYPCAALYNSETYPSYAKIAPMVTCNYAAVVFTFLSSVNSATLFSSIDFLIVFDNYLDSVLVFHIH